MSEGLVNVAISCSQFTNSRRAVLSSRLKTVERWESEWPINATKRDYYYNWCPNEIGILVRKPQGQLFGDPET